MSQEFERFAHDSVVYLRGPSCGVARIRLPSGGPEPSGAAASLIRHVVDSFVRGEVNLAETFAYGMSELQLRPAAPDEGEIWETTLSSDWVAGARQTLEWWVAQRSMCFRVGSRFEPPSLGDWCMLRVGTDAETMAQRTTPIGPDDSGWSITSGEDVGSSRESCRVSVRDVLAERPEAAAFLALAPGHRVLAWQGASVVFESESPVR